MSAPVLLIILSILLVVLLMVLARQQQLAVLVCGLGSILIGAMVLLITLDVPLVLLGQNIKIAGEYGILGRKLIVGATNRAAISFFYIVGGIYFLSKFGLELRSRHIIIGVLLQLSVALSMMVEPFLYAAIFLEGAALLAFLLLAEDSNELTGAQRLVGMYTFAMVAVLSAGWILDVQGVTAGTHVLAVQTQALLFVGFSILMCIPPFHLWMTAASRDVSEHQWVLIFIILQSAGLFFVLRFFNEYAWLRDNEVLTNSILHGGLIVTWFGALMTIAQKDTDRIMLFCLISDIGVMMMALGIHTSSGYQIALTLNASRALGLIVWTAGLSRNSLKSTGQELNGKAQQNRLFPAQVVTAGIGLLTVSGFPLSAGFPNRWGLLQINIMQQPLYLLTVIGSMVLISISIYRWARLQMDAAIYSHDVQLSRVRRNVLIMGSAICILTGLFPQLIFPWVVRVAEGIINLI